MRVWLVVAGVAGGLMLAGCASSTDGASSTGATEKVKNGRTPIWKGHQNSDPTTDTPIIAGEAVKKVEAKDSGPSLVRKIDAAIVLAEAAVAKQYGQETAAAQRPYTAVIVNQRHWLVTGTPVGGKAVEVRLRVAGGDILSVEMLPASSLPKLPPRTSGADYLEPGVP